MVEKIIEKVVLYLKNDVKRINHVLKVHAFAKLISSREGIVPRENKIIELASILHDIGIKEAERKYQSTAGKYQELEGPPIAKDLLLACGVEQSIIERVCFLVGNHHSYQKTDGIDFQILVEADFIVNICEDGIENSNILNIAEKYIKTDSGKKFIKSMYIDK
jgi:HD superfamily phosphodiesterase